MRIPKVRTVCTTVLGLLLLNWSAGAQDSRVDQLADAVIKASGGDHWPEVKVIDFTFNVEEHGKKLLIAKHQWNVATNTDIVNWNGKTVTVHVKVKPSAAEELDAYQRWVNDSYWLLAPLKLKDSGTLLKYIGVREVDGMKYEVIEMSFREVGLTSGDHYDLYIDPRTH